MSSVTAQHYASEVKHPLADSRSAPSLEVRHPVAGDLKFTLTFGLTTPMEEIQDRVIELVLGFTNGNRKLAGQLLGINPRTIRRRLGKKSGTASALIASA